MGWQQNAPVFVGINRWSRVIQAVVVCGPRFRLDLIELGGELSDGI